MRPHDSARRTRPTSGPRPRRGARAPAAALRPAAAHTAAPPRPLHRAGRSTPLLAAVVLTLLLPGFAAPAAAQVCAAPRTIQLNLVIEISHAMDLSRSSGRLLYDSWKWTAAADLASGILDGFQADGVLSAAGGLSIPTDWDDWPVSAASIPEVDEWAEIPGLLERYQDRDADLFEAIRFAGEHMAGLSGSGKVIVVISHLEHLAFGGSETAAARALASSGAASYLYYVGDLATSDSEVRSDGNSYASLQRIASDARTRGADAYFSRIARGTSIGAFVDHVLEEEGCANWRPEARATVTPDPLRLGDPGFTVELDASASSDIETSAGGLRFEWTLTRPDGTPGPTHAGTGSAGAVFIPPAFTTADIGPWPWRVVVRDRDGASHDASGVLEVLNSPPRIALEGGGTIDVLEDLAVRTTITEDLDGGTLTYTWEQVTGPYDREGEGGSWSCAEPRCAELRWTTTEDDITVLSDGSPYASAWTLRLTVTDDEDASTSETVTVDVANLPVAAEIDGPTTVRTGERFVMRSVENADPDGGDVIRTWDVLQAPIGYSGAASFRTGYDVPAGDSFPFATTPNDAGTWTFRLNMTDDEDELAADTLTVLVAARPDPDVEPRPSDRIGSLSDPLSVDGEASTDPDSRCCGPDWWHDNLEGPVEGITTPPIVRWSWRLVDVPLEQREAYPTGGVEDVLGVVADGPRVDLSPGMLPPGEWTFQLQVEDAEGDTADTRTRVEVLDESGDPVAVVTPPRRYVLFTSGRPPAPVRVDADGSIDPDNLRSGEPLPGIEEWEWTVLSRPEGCSAPDPPTATDQDSWTLFEADEVVDLRCQGVWHIRLTVTDDDEPTAREASAETSVVVSNCPTSVCIDYPVTGDPVLIRPGEEIDVPILYHVESGLPELPRFANGMAARLEIVPAAAPESPVYTAYSPNISPPEVGASLGFHWTGHRGVRGARPGPYHVRVSLLDDTGTPVSTAQQENAIAIGDDEGLFDCGSLWTLGFPDGRDGGAFPCVEYVEPFAATAAGYRIYHPPNWDLLLPRNPGVLRWTAEGVRDAWTTLSTLGGLPELAVVISSRPPPDPEIERSWAVTWSGWPDPGEPCPIVVYPTGLRTDADTYRQLIAHEVVHCFQGHNFGSMDEWMGEGTAEYLSNVVYPTTNAEFMKEDDFVHDLPLIDHVDHDAYGTAVFFQSLANRPAFGESGVVDVIDVVTTDAGGAGPGAALASIPGMGEAFHTFAENWYASNPGGVLVDGVTLRWTRVADDGGGHWPSHSPESPTVAVSGSGLRPAAGTLPAEVSLDGDAIVGRYAPLSIFDVRVRFGYNHIYRVTATHTGADGRASLLPSAGLGTWNRLPVEVRPGCGAGRSSAPPVLPIVATDISPSTDDHEVRITITADPDPSCR